MSAALGFSIESVFGEIVVFLLLLVSCGCRLSMHTLCVHSAFLFRVCGAFMLQLSHFSCSCFSGETNALSCNFGIDKQHQCNLQSYQLRNVHPGHDPVFRLGPAYLYEMTVWMCTYLFAFPVH